MSHLLNKKPIIHPNQLLNVNHDAILSPYISDKKEKEIQPINLPDDMLGLLVESEMIGLSAIVDEIRLFVDSLRETDRNSLKIEELKRYMAGSNQKYEIMSNYWKPLRSLVIDFYSAYAPVMRYNSESRLKNEIILFVCLASKIDVYTDVVVDFIFTMPHLGSLRFIFELYKAKNANVPYRKFQHKTVMSPKKRKSLKKAVGCARTFIYPSRDSTQTTKFVKNPSNNSQIDPNKTKNLSGEPKFKFDTNKMAQTSRRARSRSNSRHNNKNKKVPHTTKPISHVERESNTQEDSFHFTPEKLKQDTKIGAKPTIPRPSTIKPQKLSLDTPFQDHYLII